MRLRRAAIDDAGAICEVVIASITQLCSADHHDKPRILDRWLAIKMPKNVARWIAAPADVNLIAESDDSLIAAGW